jgi:hypothetical protein
LGLAYLISSMKPIGVDDCLALCWHLLKKLIKIGLRDSVSSDYDSLLELIVALKMVIIVLLDLILHPIPNHLNWV